MKGLELCRLYYEEVGAPALKAAFPELMGRAAAGLAGQGSDCLGFDDEYSRDHDFGPGFLVWLTDADFEEYGAALQAAYEACRANTAALHAGPRTRRPARGRHAHERFL